MADIPIIGLEPKQEALVEVCRSFSYKLNLANHGGPAYESADFFASRKVQCMQFEVNWMSQQIFDECVAEVRESVSKFKAEMVRKQAKRAERKIA